MTPVKEKNNFSLKVAIERQNEPALRLREDNENNEKKIMRKKFEMKFGKLWKVVSKKIQKTQKF